MMSIFSNLKYTSYVDICFFFNVQENVKRRKKLIKIISNYFDLNVLLTNCLQMCCMQHSFRWRYKYYDLCQFPCKPRKDFKYFEFFLHFQGLLVHVSVFFFLLQHIYCQVQVQDI